MSIVITVDSSTLPTQNPSELRVNVNPPIILPNLAFEVGMSRINTWYTHYNITAVLLNNTFRYSNDNASTWVDIVIPDGIYSMENIDTYIHSQLKVNGDTTTDGSGNDVFPITIQPEGAVFSTGRSEIVIDSVNFTPAFQVDLQSSVPGLQDLLGYDDQILTATAVSENIADINNGVNAWHVHSNLVGQSYTNGVSSDVIYQFTPRVAPGSNVQEEPNNIIYVQVASKIISNVTLKLTDQQNRLISLNGENITYQLHIRAT